MAFDPEEMNRRRQARKLARSQRQAKRRRTFIKLCIAAAVLAVCLVLIFVLTKKKAPEPSTEQQAQETTVIHLAAAGDLNINDTTVGAGGASYDYSKTFLDVAHLFAGADAAFLNFEGNLMGTPYGSKNAFAPQTMMQALKSAGMDMLQLANSYAIYNGTSGLANTIRGVSDAGMVPLGVYETNADFRTEKGFILRDIHGVRVAFTAFTKGMDGLALPPGSENCVNILYTDYASTYQEVDTERITQVLTAIEKEKPDITIALLHWGSEFNDTISKSQQEICTLMQENGVDAIIGTHSHYVQKIEHDPQSGRFVAYSLGDFFSDAKRAGTEYSIILDLEITKNNRTGATKITSFSYTPIFTVAEENKPMRILRIHEAIAAYENNYIDRVSPQTYEAMKYALSRIDARISGK